MNVLSSVDEDDLPQVLFTLSHICLCGSDEQMNLSDNEIWPTLDMILENVSFGGKRDS